MQFAQLPQPLHLLPGRFGPRPRTTIGLPFRQLDQLPAAEITDRLLELCLDLPHVRARRSRMAEPGTTALWLGDGVAAGPTLAFIDAREFCHLHPAPYGSIHLTLPAAEVEGIVALGWAERHPIHHIETMESLVLVYAPRTAEELDVAVGLVRRSSRFAMGPGGAALVL